MARELFQEVHLKSVNKMADNELAYLNTVFEELRKKIAGCSKNELFHNYSRNLYNDTYVFCGYVSDRFIELLGRMPTPREIIMTVDNGINHAGAWCSMNGRGFSGRVNIV